MSEDSSGRPPREWRFYLEDMTGFAKKVLAYTDGFDRQSQLFTLNRDFAAYRRNGRERIPLIAPW